MLFDVNTHPVSLHASLQIIITKNELKGQYTKLIQFWTLTVQLSQMRFSVSFNRAIISCQKSVFSTHSIDYIKKQPKFGVIAPTSPCYNVFANGFSVLKNLSRLKDLWTYPFMIIYLNTTKVFHCINRNILQLRFYAASAPGLWTMHL